MSRHRLGSRLSTPGFKREFLSSVEQHDVMTTYGEALWAESQPGRFCTGGTARLVTGIRGIVGDGKEATVYTCDASPETGRDLAVAKVYRAQRFRAFSGAAQYAAGSELRDKRAARAVRQKSRRGRQIAHRHWIEREWETLCRLHDAGADIPAPLAHAPDSILMEYAGNADGAAPQLRQVDLDPERALGAFDDVLRNVALFLSCDRIHADLSAYNILWWQERPWIIDLPQAVEASTHPEAPALLARDVRNVCAWFARAGVDADAEEIVRDLWERFRRGRL